MDVQKLEAMAGGDLNVALILKLVDQVTGPAKPALAAIRQINEQTEAMGRAGVSWSRQQKVKPPKARIYP